MRIFCLQAGLTDYHSHFYLETLGLIAACRNLGVDLRIYANDRATSEVLAETGAIPTFRGVFDMIGYTDPIHGPLANFIVFGEWFAKDCARLNEAEIGSDDLILIPYTLVRHLHGLGRWLRTLPANRRPAVACRFCVPGEAWVVSPASDQVEGDRSFIHFAVADLRSLIPARRLLLWATTPKLARIVSTMAAHPCGRLPLAKYYPTIEEIDRLRLANAHPRVGACIPGQSRLEKGGSLVPEIVAAFASRYSGLALSVQVNDAAEASSLRTTLSDQGIDARLFIQVGESARMDYFARLLAADLVLLPYHADSYAARASGVFADAVACGVPVVVPAHTWMARTITAGLAAGRAFEAFSTASVIAALSSAIENLPALAAQAHAGGKHWHANENIFEFTRLLVAAAKEASAG